MQLQRYSALAVHNAFGDRARPYSDTERQVLSQAGFRTAKTEISSWPGYRPTPLLALKGLAGRLDVGQVLYKDEGQRLGLKSFKAIGGAYAVLTVLKDHLSQKHGVKDAAVADLVAGKYRAQLSDVTVAAATDGNHGRSVAWGAQLFGAHCIIYLHSHVSPTREREIARFGAKITRVKGHYDDSVRDCAVDAAKNGWVLVADTSSDPKARVPSLIMQGYSLIADEVLTQTETTGRPTHVFVQAGVGGLAAAFGAHYWELFGKDRPRLIVVEPIQADCVFRSIAAGAPTMVPGDTNTVMACLAAGQVSAPAWVVMQHAVDDVLALPEDAAPDAMRILAAGIDGDPAIVAGESGCAATAGLIAAALDPKLKDALGLDSTSRALVIGSEGATDEDAYLRIVGRPSEAVAA